jgi:hypothetical protein
LDGTFDYGACGIVPLIKIDQPKPKLRNNGFNCYGGHPVVHVPGLSASLPDEGRPIRQGHVMVVYRDGKRFGTYADTIRGNDLYSFS